MKCVMALSRSLPPRDWIHQRYREFLSLAAHDLALRMRIP